MMTRYEYLKEAENNKSQVVIRYKPKGKPVSKRTISNIQITTFRRQSGYYITAYCHKVQAERTFKISRIRSIDGCWFIPEHLENIGVVLLKVIWVLISMALFLLFMGLGL